MKTLKEVSRDLGLDFSETTQDWGCENADKNRVDEFIFYFSTLDEVPLAPHVKEEVAWLVIESASERYDEDGRLHPRLIGFLKEHRSEFPHTYRYWFIEKSEQFQRDFPIVTVILSHFEAI